MKLFPAIPASLFLAAMLLFGAPEASAQRVYSLSGYPIDSAIRMAAEHARVRAPGDVQKSAMLSSAPGGNSQVLVITRDAIGGPRRFVVELEVEVCGCSEHSCSYRVVRMTELQPQDRVE